MKATVYIATSLDGFIARKDGDIKWLHHPDYMIEGEDYGYSGLMASVDALVMGSGTFDVVSSFAGDWPYGEKRVIVLSSRQLNTPPELSATVEQMGGSPIDILAELGERGMQHLYIDGGKTAQAFLSAGLIDELIITRVPLILGEGIPLFAPVEQDIELIHVKTEAYTSGLVQSHYHIRR